MSNYHVLVTAEKLTWAQVVFHLPVPDEDNNDSTNYRTAVYEWQGGGTITSVVPNLETEFATEYADLQTGTILEVVKKVEFTSADLTNLQKRGEIDAKYTDLATNYINDHIKKILKYWGMDRNVPV